MFLISSPLILLHALFSCMQQPEEVQPPCCGRYALRLVADFLGKGQPGDFWERLLPSQDAPFSLAQLAAAA